MEASPLRPIGGGLASVFRESYALAECSAKWEYGEILMSTHETRRAVMRLAHEHPDWLPVLRAACSQARQTEHTCGEFAGSWVLQEVTKETGRPEWRPGLRLLSSSGLIEKTDTARGGRRAYYRMPDREGVEQALAEIGG